MAEKKRGRDYKPGLDRTQFDTNFARKSASLSIRQKYGLEGLAVLYEVIVWINEEKGCYAEAPTLRTAAENFAMTRLFDVSKIDWVLGVFETMFEVGFFDREAFETDQILTSKGIVRRWYSAKRNPDSYPLPESIQSYFVEEPPTETEQQIPETEQQIPETEQQIRQRKEKKSTKKRKKEKSAVVASDSDSDTPDPGQPPAPHEPALFVRGSRGDPHWGEVRARIARMIYSDYLSADLVDAITAAAVNRWITVSQLEAWIREARDERELYRSSKAYAGKAKLWEVLRPRIEDVYLAHGMVLPPCDRSRREPPPEPERTRSADVGYDAATRAGRAVMAVT